MKITSEKYSTIPLIALIVSSVIALILIYFFGVPDTAGIFVAVPVFVGVAMGAEKMFEYRDKKSTTHHLTDA